MSVHFEHELGELKQTLLAMAYHAETAVARGPGCLLIQPFEFRGAGRYFIDATGKIEDEVLFGADPTWSERYVDHFADLDHGLVHAEHALLLHVVQEGDALGHGGVQKRLDGPPEVDDVFHLLQHVGDVLDAAQKALHEGNRK